MMAYKLPYKNENYFCIVQIGLFPNCAQVGLVTFWVGYHQYSLFKLNEPKGSGTRPNYLKSAETGLNRSKLAGNGLELVQTGLRTIPIKII